MKINRVSKFVGAGVLAASLAVAPLTIAQAQNTAPDTTTTQQNSNTDATGPIDSNTERDDNNDLGWFGLLGLIGLAGLAGKKRKQPVQHVSSEPDVRVRSTSDYR
jgi:LPXTG-motif cell wall-anchored protein